MNQESLRQRDFAFEREVLHALGVLREIASGLTQRGRRVKSSDSEPGTRPLRMAEVAIATKIASQRLNAAINAFADSQPKPWDWNNYLTPLTQLKPAEISGGEPAICVDCRQTTLYWLADSHIPLCADCCARRSEKPTV